MLKTAAGGPCPPPKRHADRTIAIAQRVHRGAACCAPACPGVNAFAACTCDFSLPVLCELCAPTSAPSALNPFDCCNAAPNSLHRRKSPHRKKKRHQPNQKRSPLQLHRSAMQPVKLHTQRIPRRRSHHRHHLPPQTHHPPNHHLLRHHRQNHHNHHASHRQNQPPPAPDELNAIAADASKNNNPAITPNVCSRRKVNSTSIPAWSWFPKTRNAPGATAALK